MYVRVWTAPALLNCDGIWSKGTWDSIKQKHFIDLPINDSSFWFNKNWPSRLSFLHLLNPSRCGTLSVCHRAALFSGIHPNLSLFAGGNGGKKVETSFFQSSDWCRSLGFGKCQEDIAKEVSPRFSILVYEYLVALNKFCSSWLFLLFLLHDPR